MHDISLELAEAVISAAKQVSGGLPKQDQDVAEEGAEAFVKLSRRLAA